MSETNDLRRAVFLDRDGVLIENHHPFVPSFDIVKVLPGSIEACLKLNQAGWPCVVVTNQGAAVRGGLSIEKIEAINSAILDLFRNEGVEFLDVRYCPHVDADRCHCRKPKPGMLTDSAELHNLNLKASYMVGDAVSDLEAARDAGAQGILVRTGRGLVQEGLMTLSDRDVWPIFADLHEAAQFIIAQGELS